MEKQLLGKASLGMEFIYVNKPAPMRFYLLKLVSAMTMIL